MRLPLPILFVALGILLVALIAGRPVSETRVQLDGALPTPTLPRGAPKDAPKLNLKHSGELEGDAKKENSGIAASPSTPGLFWGINDSGNPPRLYPFSADGAAWGSHAQRKKPGLFVTGAQNVDWEDIAADPSRNELIIADVGNNWSSRRQITFYRIPEPNPDLEHCVARQTLHAIYPDQRTVPSPGSDRNFDCEAIFVANSKIHLLSKRREDRATRLYRVDPETSSNQPVPLTLLAHWRLEELVTGADLAPNAEQLAISTYDSIWILRFDPNSQTGIGAPERFAPYTGPKQVEAITWLDSERLLISDEKTGRLYQIPTANLRPISSRQDR